MRLPHRDPPSDPRAEHDPGVCLTCGRYHENDVPYCSEQIPDCGVGLPADCEGGVCICCHFGSKPLEKQTA